MSDFTFPKPNERTNATSIPVPERTLAALYALALVGARSLRIDRDDYVTPQCADALDVCVVVLSETMVKVAIENATTMERDRDAGYPF